MRAIFRPLPRLPFRAAGPLTVSVITPFPPYSVDPRRIRSSASPFVHFIVLCGALLRFIAPFWRLGDRTESAVQPRGCRPRLSAMAPCLFLDPVPGPDPRADAGLIRLASAVVHAMSLVVPIVGIRLTPAQFSDRLLEVIKRLEAPVHRGEPEVRDFVKIAERPKDGQPHLVGRHLRKTARPDGLLDPL